MNDNDCEARLAYVLFYLSPYLSVTGQLASYPQCDFMSSKLVHTAACVVDGTCGGEHRMTAVHCDVAAGYQ